MAHFRLAYSQGIPLLSSGDGVFTGNTFFVDSGHEARGDADGYGSKDQPFATLAYAVTKCTANNGDRIYVAEGHTETIATSTAFNASVAGVTIIGCGFGYDRPKITVGTAADATLTVSGASVGWYNCIIIGALDGLNSLFTITGTDFHCDLETWDTSSTVESDIAFTVTGDRPRIKAKHRGFAGDQMDDYITLEGVDNARIDVDFYGKAANAIVRFINTACTDVEVRGTTYNSGTTNGAKNVVDTVGGSTWYMDIIDATAGSRFTGGSAAAIASDDISTISSNLGTVATAAATGAVTATDNAMAYIKQLVTMLGPTELDVDTLGSLIAGAGGIGTMPNAAVPANNINMFELLRSIWGNLCGTAAGENGIATWPASAAPGNNVSIAEALGYLIDQIIRGSGTALPTNQSIYDLVAGANGIAAWPASAAPGNAVSLAAALGYINQKVTRTSKVDLVAANLTGTVTRFTISGGPILVRHLGLLVTTAIDAGANTLKFQFDVDGAGAAADLSGATDTASAAANQLFIVDGVKATALVKVTDPGIMVAGNEHMPIILAPGVIQTVFSAGAPANGAGTVFMQWEPLTNVSVVA